MSIPVIANGEVWNEEDARRCLAESGCDQLMLGRGAVADPFLAERIRFAVAPGWDEVCLLLLRFIADSAPLCGDLQLAGRLKQWMNYLRRRWPQAQVLYDQVKRCRSVADIRAAVDASISLAA